MTMKKVSLLLFGMFLGILTQSVAHAPTDFFTGKWEITVTGTPNGDAKMVANFARKDGKLSGELENLADPNKEKIPVTQITESADKLSMAFTAQGYDVTLDLSKVDDDNLKGTLMNMFDATAKRVK